MLKHTFYGPETFVDRVKSWARGILESPWDPKSYQEDVKRQRAGTDSVPAGSRFYGPRDDEVFEDGDAADTSMGAIRERLGTRPGTEEEFVAEHGPVSPPDDDQKPVEDDSASVEWLEEGEEVHETPMRPPPDATLPPTNSPGAWTAEPREQELVEWVRQELGRSYERGVRGVGRSPRQDDEDACRIIAKIRTEVLRENSHWEFCVPVHPEDVPPEYGGYLHGRGKLTWLSRAEEAEQRAAEAEMRASDANTAVDSMMGSRNQLLEDLNELLDPDDEYVNYMRAAQDLRQRAEGAEAAYGAITEWLGLPRGSSHETVLATIFERIEEGSTPMESRRQEEMRSQFAPDTELPPGPSYDKLEGQPAPQSDGENQTWWRHPETGRRVVRDRETNKVRPAKLYEGGPTGWLVETGKSPSSFPGDSFEEASGVEPLPPSEFQAHGVGDKGVWANGVWLPRGERTDVKTSAPANSHAEGRDMPAAASQQSESPGEASTEPGASESDPTANAEETASGEGRDTAAGNSSPSQAHGVDESIADHNDRVRGWEATYVSAERCERLTDQSAQPTPEPGGTTCLCTWTGSEWVPAEASRSKVTEPEIEWPVTWRDEDGDRGRIFDDGVIHIDDPLTSNGMGICTTPEDRARIRRALEAIDGIGSEPTPEPEGNEEEPEPLWTVSVYRDDLDGGYWARADRGDHHSFGQGEMGRDAADQAIEGLELERGRSTPAPDPDRQRDLAESIVDVLDDLIDGEPDRHGLERATDRIMGRVWEVWGEWPRERQELLDRANSAESELARLTDRAEAAEKEVEEARARVRTLNWRLGELSQALQGKNARGEFARLLGRIEALEAHLTGEAPPRGPVPSEGSLEGSAAADTPLGEMRDEIAMRKEMQRFNTPREPNQPPSNTEPPELMW